MPAKAKSSPTSCTGSIYEGPSTMSSKMIYPTRTNALYSASHRNSRSGFTNTSSRYQTLFLFARLTVLVTAASTPSSFWNINSCEPIPSGSNTNGTTKTRSRNAVNAAIHIQRKKTAWMAGMRYCGVKSIQTGQDAKTALIALRFPQCTSSTS